MSDSKPTTRTLLSISIFDRSKRLFNSRLLLQAFFVLILLCIDHVASREPQLGSQTLQLSSEELARFAESIEYSFASNGDSKTQVIAENKAQNFQFSARGASFTICKSNSNSSCGTSTQQPFVSFAFLGANKNSTPILHQSMPFSGLNSTRIIDSGTSLRAEYINQKTGARNNLIVKKKPLGSGPLTLKYRLTTDLKVQQKSATEIEFIDISATASKMSDHHCNGHKNSVSDKNEIALRYSDLHVFDAKNLELPAHFELTGHDLAVVVDDSRADYPIVVDPIATSPSWSVESNQELAQMGRSVSFAGDVNSDGYGDVIIGSPLWDGGQTDEGRVQVFHGSATGLSTTAAWTFEINQTGANVGICVCSAGDVNGDGIGDIVFGAPFWRNAGNVTVGRIWIFHGSATGLPAVASTTIDGEGGQFGASVTVAGDVNNDTFSDILVGAWVYTNGQADEGKCYVYYGSNTGVNTVAAWTKESNNEGAWFGSSLSTAGDINGDLSSDIVIGLHMFSNGQMCEGAAWVFYGSGAGLANTADWTVESNQPGAHLGSSVSTAGDLNGDGYSDIMVAGHLYTQTLSSEGVVYIFHGGANGLTSSPNTTIYGGQDGCSLGGLNGTTSQTIACAGDVDGDGYSDVILGAPYWSNPQQDEGRAMVYRGSRSGIVTTPIWTYEANQGYSNLGAEVGCAGDVNGDGFSDILLSNHNYDNPDINEGRVMVFHGGAENFSSTPNWQNSSNQANANGGYCVAGAGDLNGDGYQDVAIGAPNYDNGQADEGAVFIFLGSSTGLGFTPNITLDVNQPNAHFGHSVASAGDVNSDGYADLIVGAPDYTNGQANEGRAFVFLGSNTGVQNIAAWTEESNQINAHFGWSVASSGDPNGDGSSDVIIGVPDYDGGQNDEGRFVEFRGSETGLANAVSSSWESNQANAHAGYSVACVGDVNADGFSDFAIGVPDFDNGQVDEGRVAIFHGSNTGVGPTPSQSVESNSANARFGISVAACYDVNGDNYSDVIVGAPNYDGGEVGEGRAYVFLGGGGGIENTAGWTYESNQANAHLGQSVSGIADCNGDGYSDAIVGCPDFDNGQANEGQVLCFIGSASGLGTSSRWNFESNSANANCGFSVAHVGDVSGDAFSDVVIGLPNLSGALVNEGRSYLFHGDGQSGVSRLGQQFKENGTTQITPILRTENQTGFKVAFKASTFFGRSDVKEQFEKKTLLQNFNSATLDNGTGFSDVGVNGLTMNRTFSGLTDNTVYKWRTRARAKLNRGIPQEYSRWFYKVENALTEGDVRVGLVPRCSLLVNAGNDTTICNGTIARLRATPSFQTGTVAYSWSPSTGLTGATSASPLCSATTSTSYVVSISDASGCTARDTVVVTVGASITANAGTDTTICPRLSATIGRVASGGTGILTYLWTPSSNLSASNTPTVSATPSITTSYVQTVTDALGCLVRDTVVVTVAPQINVDAGQDKWICPSGSTTIGTVPTGGTAPLTVSWAPTSGLNNPSLSTPIASPLATTTYVLSVADSRGCVEFDTVQVIVSPPLIANAGTDVNICRGQYGRIGGKATGGTPPYSYLWSPANGLSSPNDSTPSCGATSTTQYVVTVTDSIGCTMSDTVLVTVRSGITAIAGADKQLCKGASVVIGDTATGGIGALSFLWTPSIGLNSNSIARPTANPSWTTSYILEATDASGCKGFDTVRVIISPDVVVSAGGDLTVCPGSTVALGGRVLSGVPPYIYTWSPALGLTSTMIPNPIATIAGPQKFVLNVVDANGCLSSDTVEFKVNPGFAVTARGTATICNGESAQLECSSTATTNSTYSWYPTNALSNVSAKNPVASPTSTTTYLVTVTDATGCSSSDSVTVTVNPSPIADAGSDATICNSLPRLIGSSPVGGKAPYTFAWTPATGLSDDTAERPLANPTATTSYTLSVTDANGCSNKDVVLVSVETPNVVATTTDLDFGLLSSCTASKVATTELTNNGVTDVTFDKILGSPNISLVSPAIPFTVKKGSKTTLQVRMSPSIQGKSLDSFSIINTVCNSTVKFKTTVEKTSLVANVTPSMIDFGRVLVCQQNPIDTSVTVTNSGSEDIELDVKSLSSSLEVRSNQGKSILKPSEMLVIPIRLKPGFASSISEQLRIPFTSASCSDSLKVQLSAIGDSPSIVSVASVTFSPLVGCEIEKDTIITLRNTGNSTSQVTKFDGGTNFTMMTPVPFDLKSGEMRDVILRFNPATSGAIDYKATLEYEPCASLTPIQLLGMKTGVSFNYPSTIDFGTLSSCSPPARFAKKLAITYTGDPAEKARVGNIVIKGPFTTSLKQGDLFDSGIEREFDVYLNNIGLGNLTGSLDIRFDPCNVTIHIDLIADKIIVQISTPDTVSLGSAIAGDLLTQSFAVKNSSSGSITIDRVDGVAAPFAIVKTVPALPTVLSKGDELIVTAQFTCELGDFSSPISIHISDPCDMTLSKTLVASGSTKPGGEVVCEIYDFDTVSVRTSKRGNLKIINKMNVNVQIKGFEWTKNEENAYYIDSNEVFTTNQFIIKSGDSNYVPVTFTPDATGYKRGDLIFKTTQTDVNGRVRGQGVLSGASGKSLVYIPRDVSVPMGERVKIPIILRESSGLDSCSAHNFEARVRFKRNILYPLNTATQTWDDEGKWAVITIKGRRQGTSGQLAEMEFTAMLGDTDFTNLEFDDFVWTDATRAVQTLTVNGTFILKDVCREGGIRLYSSSGKVELMQNTPNPFAGLTEIEYELSEEGMTKLFITDLLGKKVKTVFENDAVPGRFVLPFDSTDMPSGSYLYVLETPSVKLVQRMEISQ